MPTALVIHAHPDDEVFANGGRIVQLASRGYRVVTVIATGGEASEQDAASSRSPVEARERRLRRYTRAIALLGAADWDWLDEPGRWIDGDPESNPTLEREDPEVLAEATAACIARHRPELILTVGADGLTGHPDHVAIGRAVRCAVQSRGTPPGGAWGARFRAIDVASAQELIRTRLQVGRVGSGRVHGTPDPVREFEVADSVNARRRALDCYRPGLGSDPLDDLLVPGARTGDSLLLRALLDVTGWRHEYYSDLTREPVAAVCAADSTPA